MTKLLGVEAIFYYLKNDELLQFAKVEFEDAGCRQVFHRVSVAEKLAKAEPQKQAIGLVVPGFAPESRPMILLHTLEELVVNHPHGEPYFLCQSLLRYCEQPPPSWKVLEHHDGLFKRAVMQSEVTGIKKGVLEVVYKWDPSMNGSQEYKDLSP